MLIIASVLPAGAAEAGRLALLGDPAGGPGAGPGAGMTKQIAEILGQAGLSVTEISGEDLSSSATFNTHRFDGVVLTDSPDFPLAARANFESFLREGGDAILLGGHPFTNPLVKYPDGQWRPAGLSAYGAQWLPAREIIAKVVSSAQPETILLKFEDGDTSAWTRNTDHPDRPTRVVSDTGHTGKGIRAEIKGLTGWDMQTINLATPAPAGHNLICFWAKGDDATPQLSLEAYEADGSRWIKVVDLKKDWQYYTLPEGQFNYIDGGEPGKRNAVGDHLNLPNARKLSFGLAIGYTTQPVGDHVFWLDEVGSAKVELPKNLDTSEKPEISLVCDYEPETLAKAERLAVCGGQDLIVASAASALEFDSCAVEGFNVAGKSKYIPLLNATDKAGKELGGVAGLTVNYGGTFAGSNWLVFGVRSPEFYRSENFGGLLKSLVMKMREPKLAEAARSDNERLETERSKYPPFNYGLSTQTIGPTYQFTEKTRLVESAEAIWDMGSNTLKIDTSPVVFEGQYHLPKNPAIKTLRDLLEKEPSFRQVLAMPFDYFVLWTYPHGWDGKWQKGLTAEAREIEYREIYDMTCYLLRTFNGSKKTFLLGHWEGDWGLMGMPMDTNRHGTPESIQGMIDWLNTRQRAVDDAKRDTPHKDVQVLHYTELNNVRKSMQGAITLTNNVLPKVNVDLVSYSSYDSLDQSEGLSAMGKRLQESLTYIESKLPPKKIDWNGKRVFVGEYGFPLRAAKTPQGQADCTRALSRAALEWGCPFVLYWEMYDNEAQEGGGNASGFWLINNKGRKQPAYLLLYRYYQWGRQWVDKYRQQHGVNPPQEAFTKAAVEWLK